MRCTTLIDNYPQYAPRTVIWLGGTVIEKSFQPEKPSAEERLEILMGGAEA